MIDSQAAIPGEGVPEGGTGQRTGGKLLLCVPPLPQTAFLAFGVLAGLGIQAESNPTLSSHFPKSHSKSSIPSAHF